MNWILLAAIVCALAACATAADLAGPSAKHRVVFEFVNEGPKQYESVLNNIQNVLKALGPQCELLVIAHGPGLGLLVHTNQAEAGRIRTLMKEKVTFAACENTMTKQQVTRSDLLPGVKTVESGVAEVIRKQEAGWVYVKSGH